MLQSTESALLKVTNDVGSPLPAVTAACLLGYVLISCAHLDPDILAVLPGKIAEALSDYMKQCKFMSKHTDKRCLRHNLLRTFSSYSLS